MAEPAYRHLRTHGEQGVLVLTITEPQLRDEVACNRLREEFLHAVSQAGAKKIAVDFRAVEFVSSVAFRPLLSLRRRVHDTGARLVLCNLSEFVSDVFRVTRLLIAQRPATSPFEEQPDLPAAIAYLNGAAGGA